MLWKIRFLVTYLYTRIMVYKVGFRFWYRYFYDPVKLTNYIKYFIDVNTLSIIPTIPTIGILTTYI